MPVGVELGAVVGQRRNTFTFRDAITKGLWVIINLSKGRLGENSAVLGSLFFTKLSLDVMAESKTPEAERKFFAIYADELQNLAGRNFATLIAEARKFRISVTAGHQFWHQLSPEMRSAMLGVGSRVFFRLHYHDAREMAGELNPAERQWYTELLTRLPRGRAVFRTSAEPPVSFTVDAHKRSQSTPRQIEDLKAHARSLYATPRDVIRQDIENRYSSQLTKDLSKLTGRKPTPPPASPKPSLPTV